ncbi:uncharacterized protein LOC108238238 isoform X2 [Kryptolebias marmoratus]|uniref:uncharacterized protein LOC108238238 isoform X2 n=1 Tax=Kryptolebias marmoratus TaxID=37003 RepID=UPI0007F9405F|nr:uncharacterized protein LOC108238238 isoform X2 [Kryptolebias marmoratus]
MACRANGGGVVVICLGLLVFVTSLCHCTKMTRLKALDEKRGNSAHARSPAGRSRQHHGRLLVGRSSQRAAELNGTNSTENVLDVVTDYQADMGWWQKTAHDHNDWPRSDIAATQRLLESESKVECTRDSMKLLVHDAAFTPAALIFVDRGHLSPLSLANLPTSCGYTIRSTQSNLVLVAPYDGCFVVVEENSYVLPLRWWGLPVRMSCPMIEHVSSVPPMVTCHGEGMVVQTEWTSSASEIKAKVNGNWESLLTAAHRCAFGVVEHPEGVVISVRYAPCLGKKDGLYTLALAVDKETKISCPSLLAAHIESTEDPVQQSEKPGGWVSPFRTPQLPLTPRSGQTGSQTPDFPQSPESPSKPNQVPKQFDPFFYYSFFSPHFTNPETTPTKQPLIPTPTKSAVPQTTDEGFHRFPFYQSPEMLPTWSQVTKSPPPKHGVDQFQYQFNLSPQFPQTPVEPPASYPKGEQKLPNQVYHTQTSPEAYSYPLYLEKLPEKPEKLHPTMSENVPFHLICTQGTTASKLAGASRGQVPQPFYLSCSQRKLTLENAASQQPHPKIPQGQEYQPIFFSCTQETQASKPTIFQPSHPESSQGQIYRSFHVLCALLRQSSQPAVVMWPQQHGATQSHRYQAFFPYYTPPQSTSKPADVTQPPQPVTPQGQVYHPLLDYFTQLKPTPKPAVALPPNPATPQHQVYQPLFDYFSQLKPTPKPAVALPPNPATPQHQVYQPLLDYFAQLKPTPKPANTQPPQPSTPQSQLYQTSLHFPTEPKLSNPTVSQPPHIDVTKGPVYHPFYNPQKPQLQFPSKPSEPQPEGSDSQTYQSLYTQPKPAINPPRVPQPSQPAAHHQMCLYNQLLPESQLAKMPGEIILGKVYGPCQLSWKVGAETSSVLKPTSRVLPAHCPHVCPSGLSNCCLQIAFHQHLHISAGQEDKDDPRFYTSQPLSREVYPDFSGSLEGGQIPQKLSEAAILESLGARTSAHISPPWGPWAEGQKPEYFQPPDGNPAALPRSSPTKTANQLPVFPYFVTDSSNPHWLLLPQHFGLPNVEQRKPAGSSDPSELWASGGKQLEPRELFNIDSPPQQNSQFLAQPTHSRPSFMSYINQHGSFIAEQRGKPNIEQSLHKPKLKSSSHHFKRALDNFFSLHYMPQDAPNSNRSNSKALNDSQAQPDSNNSTKPEQALNSHSRPQSYVLLRHGPPRKQSIGFGDDSVDVRNLVHVSNSKMEELPGHQSTNQNVESLQEESQQFKRAEEEESTPLLDINYIQKLNNDLDLPFSSVMDDSDLVYLPPEQYFSAAQLKPEILKSFEDLWKSLTPSDSSQSFAAHVPGKRTSSAEQT